MMKKNIIFLPESFSDHQFSQALNGYQVNPSFPLVYGLLTRLRAGYFRVYGRSSCYFPRYGFPKNNSKDEEKTETLEDNEVFDEILYEELLRKKEQQEEVNEENEEEKQYITKEEEEQLNILSSKKILFQQYNQFYQLVINFLSVEDQKFIINSFTPNSLWRMSEELTIKLINLSPKLQKELMVHPIFPYKEIFDEKEQKIVKKLQVYSSLVEKIHVYFKEVERPSGTFHQDKKLIQQIKEINNLPRQECRNCKSLRKFYCGKCLLKVENFEEYLEQMKEKKDNDEEIIEENKKKNKLTTYQQINLPYDILLLLHYQESVLKCTGIHVSLLANPNHFSVVDWTKSTEEKEEVVRSLDSERDVLLFPTDDSVLANEYDWNFDYDVNKFALEGSTETSMSSKRKRLVVIEASWNYAKTMANEIIFYRKKLGLPPITMVKLSDIVGRYWRFQSEGNQAVSTIEAIYYTLIASGLDKKLAKNLLLLFEIQKYNVLNNDKDKKKTPRAVCVSGVGLGDWNSIETISQ